MEGRRALLEVLFIFAIHQSVKYSQYHCQRKLHSPRWRRHSTDGGGEKDLEPVPRSVLKCDTDADSELKQADEKGMRWKGVALVFLLFLRCERKGFIPVPQTTSAWLKCLAQ